MERYSVRLENESNYVYSIRDHGESGREHGEVLESNLSFEIARCTALVLNKLEEQKTTKCSCGCRCC